MSEQVVIKFYTLKRTITGPIEGPPLLYCWDRKQYKLVNHLTGMTAVPYLDDWPDLERVALAHGWRLELISGEPESKSYENIPYS